jgi:hypothetical protein
MERDGTGRKTVALGEELGARQMDRFLDAWMQGVRPLRLKHGFRIDAAWGSFRNGTSSPCAMSYDAPGMRM